MRFVLPFSIAVSTKSIWFSGFQTDAFLSGENWKNGSDRLIGVKMKWNWSSEQKGKEEKTC